MTFYKRPWNIVDSWQFGTVYQKRQQTDYLIFLVVQLLGFSLAEGKGGILWLHSRRVRNGNRNTLEKTEAERKRGGGSHRLGWKQVETDIWSGVAGESRSREGEGNDLVTSRSMCFRDETGGEDWREGYLVIWVLGLETFILLQCTTFHCTTHSFLVSISSKPYKGECLPFETQKSNIKIRDFSFTF